MAVLSRHNTNKNQKVSVGPAVLVVAMDSAVGSSTAGPIGFANNSTAPYHGSVNWNATNNSSRIDPMASMATILPEHDNPNRTQVHTRSGLDDIPSTTGPIFPREEEPTTTSSKTRRSVLSSGDLSSAFTNKCETPNEHALAMPRRLEEVFTKYNVTQSYHKEFLNDHRMDMSILHDAILQCRDMEGVSQEDIDCCLRLLDHPDEIQCDDVWTKFRNLPGLNRKVASIIKEKMSTDFFKMKNELWDKAKIMYRWNSDSNHHYKDAYDLALVIMETTKANYGNYDAFFKLSNEVRRLRSNICGSEKDDCELLANMLTSVGWSDYWLTRGVEALECLWESSVKIHRLGGDMLFIAEWKAYVDVSRSKSDRDALKAFLMSRRSHFLSMASRIKSTTTDKIMKKFADKMEKVVNVWETKPIKGDKLWAQLVEYVRLQEAKNIANRKKETR